MNERLDEIEKRARKARERWRKAVELTDDLIGGPIGAVVATEEALSEILALANHADYLLSELRRLQGENGVWYREKRRADALDAQVRRLQGELEKAKSDLALAGEMGKELFHERNDARSRLSRIEEAARGLLSRGEPLWDKDSRQWWVLREDVDTLRNVLSEKEEG